jgi:TrmH family RNA methyltransferase
MTIIPILIRPQMGENIGATARAMANFGVTQLRLVSPRDGWPNPKAGDVAGKAIPILDDAELFETPRAAVEDCQFVLATSSRSRAVNMPAMDLREAMVELRTRIARGERCAVMFGPERTGLEIEDVALADAVVSIPVADAYPSLNVSQAVVCVMYEWFVSAPRAAAEKTPDVATRDELFGFFDQFEAALDAVNFWRVPEKKAGMWRNIRAVLTRAQMNAQEVATWRGIVRSFHAKD